ncbi:MAG: cysteine--tRNA ligase, partial [Alphaproteobacteria bacterium]
DLVGVVNKNFDALSKQDATKISDLMKKFDTVLGVLPDKKTRELSPEEQDIINRRQEARLAKDWATADALKADLLARGIEVKDTPQGPQIRFV